MKVEISKHCVERWRDRFRPGLGLTSARRELVRILESVGGRLVDLAPEWSGLTAADSHTSYLVVGEDLVLVLVERGERLVAKTCVPRASITPRERERRNSRRRRSRRGPRGGRRREGRRPDAGSSRDLRTLNRSVGTPDLLSAEYERMF
jgi:hypothetical protein